MFLRFLFSILFHVCSASVLIASAQGVTPAAIEELRETSIETGDGDRVVERGYLVTPYFHSRSDGDTFRIPFVRFRTSDETPAPPVFLLPGGPGSTYLDDLDEQDFMEWLDGFLETSDVVLLEQRGADTAIDPASDRPTALTCPIQVDIAPDNLVTPAMYQGFMAEGVRKCAEGYRREEVALEAYTILEMAADYHRLRAALGYDQFNLMGGSFGSQLGFTIIRMDEASVHRAIFYGVEGPSNTIDQVEYVDRHIDRVGAAIDHNWQMRLVAGKFRSALSGLVERLEREPLRGTVEVNGAKLDVAVGAFDLKLMLWSQQGMKGYRDKIARIGQLLSATAIGREEYLLKAKADLVESISGPEGLSLNLMTFLVDCSSLPRSQWSFPHDPAGFILGSEIIDSELRAICTALDMPVIDPVNLEPVTSDTPVVLVSGGLDGFTPPEYARDALEGLANGYLVDVPVGDHDGWSSLASDKAYQRAALAFLAGTGSADDLPNRIDLPRLTVEIVPTWVIALSALFSASVIGLGWLGVRRMRRAGRSRRSAR